MIIDNRQINLLGEIESINRWFSVIRLIWLMGKNGFGLGFIVDGKRLVFRVMR